MSVMATLGIQTADHNTRNETVNHAIEDGLLTQRLPAADHTRVSSLSMFII